MALFHSFIDYRDRKIRNFVFVISSKMADEVKYKVKFEIPMAVGWDMTCW